MKVLKPFNRGGQHYARGSDAPADLDKATIAHYRRHGMVTAEDAKAAEGSSTASPAAPAAPARKPRQVSPSETKPAGPSETKPAAPSGTTAAGEGGFAPVTTGITSESFKTSTTDDVVTGDVGKGDGSAAGPSLPLGN